MWTAPGPPGTWYRGIQDRGREQFIRKCASRAECEPNQEGQASRINQENGGQLLREALASFPVCLPGASDASEPSAEFPEATCAEVRLFTGDFEMCWELNPGPQAWWANTR